jgi:hypothetical protein
MKVEDIEFGKTYRGDPSAWAALGCELWTVTDLCEGVVTRIDGVLGLSPTMYSAAEAFARWAQSEVPAPNQQERAS